MDAHIQQILAEVEDEFQPAGSIQPEIDIFPPRAEDPFCETFAAYRFEDGLADIAVKK